MLLLPGECEFVARKGCKPERPFSIALAHNNYRQHYVHVDAFNLTLHAAECTELSFKYN